jgi:hypothetical protein
MDKNEYMTGNEVLIDGGWMRTQGKWYDGRLEDLVDEDYRILTHHALCCI